MPLMPTPRLSDDVLATFSKAGPWALLAVLLIGAILFEIRPALAAFEKQHTALQAALAEQRAEDGADFKAIQNLLGQILMSAERTAYLQRVQCQNEADTQAELRACAKDRD